MVVFTKPENICLDAAGYPKLVGFSNSRNRMYDAELGASGRSVTVCGSPEYLGELFAFASFALEFGVSGVSLFVCTVYFSLCIICNRFLRLCIMS